MPECPACGVIFARLRPADERPDRTDEVLPPSPPSPPPPPSQAPAATGYLVVGFGIALIFVAVGPLRFVFSYLLILVHELGHTAAAWIFGFPTIPSLDLRYGGGVSLHGARHPAVVIAVALLLAWGVRVLWPLPRWRVLGLAVAGFWLLALITGFDEVIILVMGHGFELAIAGLFLYRALTGRSLRTPAERPAYAFAGWFIVLYDLRFAWQLATDPDHRTVYEQAKGGGHWMDFSRLGREFLGLDLGTVATLFLLATALVPLVAWLASRNIGAGPGNLVQEDPVGD